jgi:hypothetical protein
MLLGKSREEFVKIGLRISDIISEENMSVQEGVTVTLSIATYGAVEAKMSESDFLDLCRSGYRGAIKSIERMKAAEQIESTKKEN